MTPEPVAAAPPGPTRRLGPVLLGPVLLVRPDGNEVDASALAAVGVSTIDAPLLQVVPIESDSVRRLADELDSLTTGDWLVVTSPRTWSRWKATVRDLDERLRLAVARGVRVATVGAATSASLPDLPDGTRSTSPGVSAEDLLGHLLAQAHSGVGYPTAVLPKSAQARSVLAQGLRAAGWTVHSVAVYQTLRRPSSLLDQPELVSGLAGVLVRSPSAADAVAELVPLPVGTPVFAVGPITAARCRRPDWLVVEVASTDAASVADRIAATLHTGAGRTGTAQTCP